MIGYGMSDMLSKRSLSKEVSFEQILQLTVNLRITAFARMTGSQG